MKTMTCVLAILAAASTAAVAKDLKQDQKATAPTVTATQLSDAEMDRVTAGSAACAHGACAHGGALGLSIDRTFPGNPNHTPTHGRWAL